MIDLGIANMVPVGPVIPNTNMGNPGSGGGNPASMELFAQPDDSVVLFLWYGVASGTVINIYQVDPSGAYTWYAINTGVAFDYFTSITPIGPGLFFCVTGRTGIPFMIKTVNMRANNAAPFIITQASPQLGDPCAPIGSSPSRIYYAKARSIIAAGYYKVAGAGAIITSQMTAVDPLTGRFGNAISGFCCNTNFGGDIFDVTQNALPPGVLIGQGFASNGKGVFLTRSNWTITAADVIINLGMNTNCDGSSGQTGSFVGTAGQVSFDSGMPDGGQNGYIVDSVIPGITGLWLSQGNVWVWNGNVEYFCGFSGIDPGQINAIAITPRKIWLFSRNAAGQFSASLLIANNPGFLSPYSGIADLKGYPSTSFARPISIYGAFKA